MYDQAYVENLRRAWQKRAIQKRENMERLRRDALQKANAAAAHLKGKYKVTAVYLYGSLAWGKHFSERSDIDLLSSERIVDLVNRLFHTADCLEREVYTFIQTMKKIMPED